MDQETLERELLSALAANLADKDLLEEIVQEVTHSIQEQVQSRSRHADEAAITLATVLHNKADLQKKANLLAEEIERGGHSPTIRRRLDEYDARIQGLEATEAELAARPLLEVPQFTDGEIRTFVAGQSGKFAEVLLGDREQAKAQIQKRLSRLTLTPKVTEDGGIYVVTGDVKLFASEDIMQSKRGESFGLHCGIPLRVEVPAARRWGWKKLPKVAASQKGEDVSAVKAESCSLLGPDNSDFADAREGAEGDLFTLQGISVTRSANRSLPLFAETCPGAIEQRVAGDSTSAPQ